MTTLRIGTSGWNYPSGKGTWNGPFYPEKGAVPKGFDELGFYAERFNTVEVNSTFYGQPRATVSHAWVKRTPPGFEFAVKLYQKFTHPNLVSDKTPVSAADVDAFKGGIEPLAAATSNAGRKPSAGRTRTARPQRSIRPGWSGRSR